MVAAAVAAVASIAPPGAAAAAEIVFEPSELQFAATAVGGTSSAEVTQVTNQGSTTVAVVAEPISGPDASQFSVAPDCPLELEPGQSCFLTVTFLPSQVGPREAKLNVWSEGTTFQAGLQGTGQSPPEGEITPGSLNFGVIDTGSSGGIRGFSLSSTGGTPLIVTSAELIGEDPEDFHLYNQCVGTFQPGEDCLITMAFTPLSFGFKAATLKLSTNTSRGEITVPLFGVASLDTRVSISPSQWDFGSVPVGTVGQAKVFTIESTGTTPLAFGSAAFVAPGGVINFQTQGGTCTEGLVLQPGQSCKVEVAFEPHGVGELEGKLQVLSNAGSEVAHLIGAGLPSPKISSRVEQFEFSAVPIGSASPVHIFRLKSTGGTPLTIESIGTEGPGARNFQIEDGGCLAESLLPGDSCEVLVTFEPHEAGPLDASLRVASDAAESQTIIPMSGTGEAVPAATPATVEPLVSQPLVTQPPAAAPRVAEAHCKVPELDGKKLKAAKKMIRAAGCRVGRVSKKSGVKAKSAKVVKQSPKPSRVLPAATGVTIKLG